MDTSAIRKQRTEIYVGLFVFFGLVVMGALILQFGRFSDRVRGHYPLMVEFPNAGGLLSGAPVKLGGQKVGYVDGDPKMKADFSGVNVLLAIYDDQKVPSNSTFSIGTSGLMGDTYVEAKMGENFTGEFLGEGSQIKGTSTADLGALQNDAGELLKELQVTVADIQVSIKSLDKVFQKLESGVLADENVANLSTTFSELKTSSQNIKKATEKLDPVMAEAQSTIAEAKSAMAKAGSTFDTATETLEGIKATVAKADPAIEKLEPTIAELKATLKNANSAIDEIKYGDGVMSGLISDSGLREDLESFIDKLERYGILGYPKDKSKPSVPSSSGASSEPKKKPFSLNRRNR